MARVNNPVLGTTRCECGESATVHRTTRGAGRFLYTRCTDCGTDQRTGAKVQTRLWSCTDWANGQPDVPPPNLLELGEKKLKPEPETEPETEADFEPGEPKESSVAGALPWLAGGLGLLALILRGRA